MKKKGLSPIVATVLLIGLVVVLAGLVFFWARGFISEKIEKFGENVDDVCERVDFGVELVEGNSILEVVNRGNVPIHNFEVKQFYSDGDSEIKAFPELMVGVGKSAREGVSFVGGDIEEISLFPRILGSSGDENKPYTCLNSGRTIKFN